MEIVETKIPDLYVVKPTVFKDSRGYFFESYNKEVFLQKGIDQNFVQDNESKSARGGFAWPAFSKAAFCPG